MTSPVPPPTAPYGPSAPQSVGNGAAVAALIVGIIAFLVGLVPIVGLVLGALAVVFGCLSFRRPTGRALGIAGLVLGAIAALTSLITTSALVVSILGAGGAAGSSARVAEGEAPAPEVSESLEAPAPAPAPAPEKESESTPEPELSEKAVQPKAKAGAEYGGYSKKQARFVKIVEAASADYAETSNELKAARVLADRDADACGAIGGSRVKSWVGTINDVGATGDGDGFVEIEIAPTIIVKTWNNSLSDAFDDTLIPPSADVYDRLSETDEGERVVFSGSFVPSEETCLDTTNLTKVFNGSDPDFLFRFSNIRAQ